MEYGKAVNYRSDEKVRGRIALALNYLNITENLVDLAVGKYQIGEGVELRMQNYLTRDVGTMKYESHSNYLDIHYMLSGEEYVRFGDVDNLKTVTEYDENEDIIFYKNPEKHSKVILDEGHYIILYPSDVHMAHGKMNGIAKEVKKIVVKIAIN